ncbi:hypothetical protein ACIPRI_03105 [Variovorax sp. LARHSF232]
MPRLRALLLWVLMLAVPFQGYAAATMVLCALPAQQAGVRNDAGPAAAHDHAKHMQHGEMAQQDDAHDSADHDQVAVDATQHKCSTCGSCHAAALISAPLPDAFHPLPQARLAEPIDARASLAPRALFKPPRA